MRLTRLNRRTRCKFMSNSIITNIKIQFGLGWREIRESDALEKLRFQRLKDDRIAATEVRKTVDRPINSSGGPSTARSSACPLDHYPQARSRPSIVCIICSGRKKICRLMSSRVKFESR